MLWGPTHKKTLADLNFVQNKGRSIPQQKLLYPLQPRLPDPNGPVGLVDVGVEDLGGKLVTMLLNLFLFVSDGWKNKLLRSHIDKY